MPLAFFAPLFLAGVALVAIPWVIHHIRRPEREPLRFSSLMFIPKVTREVIERRRIQHWLLMLLRMIVLVALVMAFARPYWREQTRPGGASSTEFHMIVLDTSFSMTAPGVFARARKLALEAMEEATPANRTGLVLFDGSPRLAVGLDDANAPETSRERIREAVEAAEPGQDVTGYVAALRFAQEQLLSATQSAEDSEEAPKPRAVIHLVSDFQKSGLPKGTVGWRLSPRIQLRCLDAGSDGVENDAVTGVSARPMTDGRLRIQARVRNGSATAEREIETRLYSGGKLIETVKPRIKPLSSTQVAFTLPTSGLKRIEGRVEIGDDAIGVDNTRNFVWSETLKRRVVCVADAESEGGWPGWLFLERAIPHAESDPWIWERHTSSAIETLLTAGAARPEVIILSEPARLDAAHAEGLLAYVRAGGKLWILLRPLPAKPDEGLARLLDALTIRVTETTKPSFSYSLLSWVDFSHPVFAPLQGERFNDFSQVRFLDYARLALATGAPARTLATLEGTVEGAEPPAIIEAPHGEGTAIVWAFSPDPSLTNFARTIKFVPVVTETLNYLTGAGGETEELFVGQRYSRPVAPAEIGGKWRIQLPGGEVRTLAPEELAAWEPPLLKAAGFLRSGAPDSEVWRTVEAVNVRPEESNLERITAEEFRLRTAAPEDGDAAWMEGATESEKVAAGYLLRREYSRWFLAVLLGLLALECWYASRILR